LIRLASLREPACLLNRMRATLPILGITAVIPLRPAAGEFEQVKTSRCYVRLYPAALTEGVWQLGRSNSHSSSKHNSDLWVIREG
jgi:hypothetical protein